MARREKHLNYTLHSQVSLKAIQTLYHYLDCWVQLDKTSNTQSMEDSPSVLCFTINQVSDHQEIQQTLSESATRRSRRQRRV